jgi:hypothetical protein
VSRVARSPAILAALSALALVTSGPSRAEEFDAGAFVVHYSAIATAQLTPEVAAAYGIARSPTRALLNVAVVRKVARTTGTPVPALVQVTALDQGGRYQPVTMRRVDEPPSIYYLGEFTVSDGATLRFEISVLAEGEKSPVRLRLQQQFFSR